MTRRSEIRLHRLPRYGWSTASAYPRPGVTFNAVVVSPPSASGQPGASGGLPQHGSPVSLPGDGLCLGQVTTPQYHRAGKALPMKYCGVGNGPRGNRRLCPRRPAASSCLHSAPIRLRPGFSGGLQQCCFRDLAARAGGRDDSQQAFASSVSASQNSPLQARRQSRANGISLPGRGRRRSLVCSRRRLLGVAPAAWVIGRSSAAVRVRRAPARGGRRRRPGHVVLEFRHVTVLRGESEFC